MTAAPQPQTTIYEKIIEDEALEKALEDRQAKKEKAATASRSYREANDVTKAKIDALDLGEDATVRVGRFALTRKRTEAAEVSFTRGGGTKTQISLIEE